MRFVVLAVSFSILAGCVKQEFFYKNEVTYDRYERDYVGCATSASQDVPTNTQVGWAPYVGIYSTDTNSALRIKSFELCMRDRGYAKATIPYCAGAKANEAQKLSAQPQSRARRMKVTQESCYITTLNGAPYLYTP